MLTTVEAEITPDGTVTLLEPVEVKAKSRALVTVLENGNGEKTGNIEAVLRVIRSPEFQGRSAHSSEEIDVQIEENRNSWE